ncbi:MAG: GNAT family N-acetyltransferase [Actinomycetota bacterium]|nr:GNAT family N-acetyltransferase [Actinomycetota bacterium]
MPVKWLNGGRGSAETVRAHAEAMWAADGPIFTFGIHPASRDTLAGTIDVQLHHPYATPEQANLAFGLYPAWRGRGLATRAVLLAVRSLHERTNIKQALIRVDPANTASSAVARRAGFRLAETTFQAERGELDWFIRNVG